MPSKFEVKVLKPYKVILHPNADKLDVLIFEGELGFRCVVGRDQFTTNDLVIFVPPDAVLPKSMVDKLNEGSKVKISNSGRIRPANIRQLYQLTGYYSEGLVLKPEIWLDTVPKEGDNVAEDLGIKKYEAPEPGFQKARKGFNPWYKNNSFPKYVDIERLQKYPNLFKEDDEVVVTVKAHGTNLRCGWVAKPRLTKWWQRLFIWFLRCLGFDIPGTEYLVGSHRTVRNKLARNKKGKRFKKSPVTVGEDKRDVYMMISDKYELKKKIYEMGLEDGTPKTDEPLEPTVVECQDNVCVKTKGIFS